MQIFTGTGGYQQITGLSTVKSLTVPTHASGALIHVESQDVRMRADGTAPTASVGLVLTAGQMYLFDVRKNGNGVAEDLTAMVFIEASASAKLNVHYLY